MTSCEDTHASMELYGSSAGSSCAIFSRSSSSIGGMSPHDLSSESSLSNVASDASDLEQGSSRGVVRFNPDEYLAAHKKALLERSRKGVPGHRMKALYSYWADFLVDNFNNGMYRSFLVLSQEDASNGHMYGLRCLVRFFKARIVANFEKDQFVEFEQLAHRFQDYLNFDDGLRALLELLTMGGTAADVHAAGVVLTPMTEGLLSAWAAHVAAFNNADNNPRAKLHQQLAEKRKQRSKAHGKRGGGGAVGAGGAPTEGADAGDNSGGSSEVTGAPSAHRRREKRDKLSAHHGGGGGGGAPPALRALRAKVPWLPSSSLPQAAAEASQHPDAQRLPDRLGDIFGD